MEYVCDVDPNEVLAYDARTAAETSVSSKP